METLRICPMGMDIGDGRMIPTNAILDLPDQVPIVKIYEGDRVLIGTAYSPTVEDNWLTVKVSLQEQYLDSSRYGFTAEFESDPEIMRLYAISVSARTQTPVCKCAYCQDTLNCKRCDGSGGSTSGLFGRYLECARCYGDGYCPECCCQDCVENGVAPCDHDD